MDATGPFVFLHNSFAASTPPLDRASSTLSVNFLVLVEAKFKNMIRSIEIAKPKIKQIKTMPIKLGPPSIKRFFNS